VETGESTRLNPPDVRYPRRVAGCLPLSRYRSIGPEQEGPPRAGQAWWYREEESLVLRKDEAFFVGNGGRIMIDIKRIRANPEEMREAICKRHVNPERANLDQWLHLDERKRALEAELAEVNAERNKLAQLGKTNPAAARERGSELRQRAQNIEEQLGPLTAEWREVLDWLPNWPDPRMPEGSGEEDNREELVWIPGHGYLPAAELGHGTHSAGFMPEMPIHADEKDFTPLHHVDLTGRLGGIDMEQAGKVSGSRFAYLLGDIALLQFGLQWLLMEKLLAEGFRPIVPPLLVRERALYGTSHFPEQREQVYAIETDNVEISRAVELQLLCRPYPPRDGPPYQTLRGHHVLPIRGGIVGQGCARHQTSSPIRQDRDDRCLRARAVARDLRPLPSCQRVLPAES